MGFKITTTGSIHRIGSSKPFRKFSSDYYGSEWENYMRQCFKDGRLYLVEDFGIIRVFDCFRNDFIGGFWYRGKDTPEGLSKEKYMTSLLVEEGKVFLLHPGKINWLLCFDEKTGKLLFEKRFEENIKEPMGFWNKDHSLHLLNNALVIESPPVIYFLNDDKIIEGGIGFVTMLGNRALFYVGGEYVGGDECTLKTIDLLTRREETFSIKIPGGLGHLTPFADNLIINGKVWKLDGTLIQHELVGYRWVNFASTEDKLIMLSSSPDMYSKGTLTRFESCPTFSVGKVPFQATDLKFL